MVTAVSVIGCGNNENSKTDNTADITATAYGVSTQSINYTYTIKDVKNQQDFLLCRETSEDLKDKPYDLDNDGVWNVFDLCIIKHRILYPDTESNDTIVVYFSRTNNTEKIADYIIDYCNWWASIPAPVTSFLKHYDMSGKTIAPFCSMGGGRFGQTISAIAKLTPNSLIEEGLDITYSSYDEKRIDKWIEDVIE